MPFVILMLALAVFAQGTSEFMLAGLLPDIAADLAITVPEAALLTSVFAVGLIIGAPLTAALSRRWSPRTALTGFLAVFIAAHVVGALTESFAILLVTRIIAALANAGFLAVTLSTVSALAPPGRSARALSVILGGTTLALIAGVPLGAIVGALLDWRAALWGVVIIAIPSLVAVAVSTPTRSEAQPVALGHELRVLRRPSLLAALALCALVNGATFCAFTFLAPVATLRAGLDEGFVPVVLAAFGVGSFGGVTVAGRFADRHAARIVSWGCAALMIGWVTFAILAASPAAVVGFALIQGLLSFAVGGTSIAMSMRAASAAPTMAGSFATAALNVGAAIGPVVGGLAYATVAGPVGPLLVSALLALIALFTVSRWRLRL